MSVSTVHITHMWVHFIFIHDALNAQNTLACATTVRPTKPQLLSGSTIKNYCPIFSGLDIQDKLNIVLMENGISTEHVHQLPHFGPELYKHGEIFEHLGPPQSCKKLWLDSTVFSNSRCDGGFIPQ